MKGVKMTTSKELAREFRKILSNVRVEGDYHYPEIKEVIFHPPATIIIWSDGFKTVVKCRANDEFDCEKGLALCVMKRVLGDRYHKLLKQCIKEAPEAKKMTLEEAQDHLNNVERYLNDHQDKELIGQQSADGMKTRYEIIDRYLPRSRTCSTCKHKEVLNSDWPCKDCHFPVKADKWQPAEE